MVLVDNSYGPGGPGMVLAGVLVVLLVALRCTGPGSGRARDRRCDGKEGRAVAGSCVGVSVDCICKWGVRKSASEVSSRRIRACLTRQARVVS